VIDELVALTPRAAGARNLLECRTVENMLVLSRLIVQGALLRPESRGAHVRKDILQDWMPDRSPYMHTYQSLSRTGIETREVQV
jgi:fumarate reductase (CoM/CoB) subunit A